MANNKLSDIEKIVREIIESKDAMQQTGEMVVELVKKRTRLGNGVTDNLKPSHKLPKLKTKTVKNRKSLKRSGKLTGPGATPAKSGLNASGSLIDNVSFKSEAASFEIILKDKKQIDKAENLIKTNPLFAFLNVSKTEFRQMVKFLENIINVELKKIKFDNFSEKINHVPFKCIKISGHNSYFCWSPTEPDANFIFKNREDFFTDNRNM